LTSFFGELRRRNVVKVAVAYAIVGWILVEVSSTVLPIFEAPDWIVQVFTFFVILGFPLALILSWAYEITPEGIKLERDVAAGESITQITGRKLDFAIIGALVMALGFVVYNYVLEGGDAAGVLPNSVAVIPFRNDSPDPNNAYYASGIHEEILNQLVKLSALNVIARTSVEQYRNTEKSIPEIARELNVETVMEGSVRYDSGRIRITTQLNDGLTGAHLWSETYTRDFDDIFAIESDVAMNVANAVGAEFSLAEQESIEKIPTDSADAHDLYLRSLVPGSNWNILLDEAIALDPDFALAHARKAYINSYNLLGVQAGVATSPEEAAELEQLIYDAAIRAQTLDPTLGQAHAILGFVHMANWRAGAAEDAFEKAEELSPNDAYVLAGYGRFKRYRGEYAEAIRLGERSVQLDPNTLTSHNQLGISYSRAGDYDAAAIQLQIALRLNPVNEGNLMQLAFVEIARGNDDEALKHLEVLARLAPGGLRFSQIVLAYGQLGRREDALKMFSVFEENEARSPVGDAVWARAYIGVGAYDQALQRLKSAVNSRVFTDFVVLTQFASNPWNDPVLNEPEFRELLDGLWD